MQPSSQDENIPLLSSETQQIEVKYTLQRALRFHHGFAFMVAMLLGSGLFVSPGLVAASSPNMMIAILAWLLSGLLSLLGASCYCELASLFRRTGGSYLYICRIFPSVFGFVFAWRTVLITSPTVIAIITYSSGTYIARMLIEDENSDSYLWTSRTVGMVFLITLCCLNCLGVRKFGIMQSVFTASQILIAVFIIGLGGWHLATVRNFDNFRTIVFVNNTEKLLTWEGVQGFGNAMYAALWAYEGWSCAPYLVEEMLNPSRNVPLVTFTSIPFVVFVYILINLSFMSALSREEMGKSASVGITLAVKVTSNKLTFVMPLLVAICCIGTLNSCIYLSSRNYMTAAREAHLPSIFSWIHKKYRTPTLAILTNFFISLAWIFLGRNLQTLMSYFNFFAWLAYILSFIGLLMLRRKEPHSARTYKVYLFTPVFMTFMSAVMCLLGVVAFPLGCGISVGFILAVALLYYLFIHRRVCPLPKVCLLEETLKKYLLRLGMVPSEPDD